MADLSTTFTGIRFENPFLLSSAPPTESDSNIMRAFEAGWGGVVTKTIGLHPVVNVKGPKTKFLRADNSGTGIGTVSFGPGQGSPPQIATDGLVSIFYNPTGNNTTVNAASYTAPTDFGFYITGAGPLTSAMLVNNVYDLQNVRNNLGGIYALGRDIDASATATWNGGAGFVPIGSASAAFTASFDGQGHTISGLVVNRPGSSYVGLFGYVGTFATVGNVGLSGGAVTGSNYVGALAGENNGSITRSYATGTVTSSGAATNTGGLTAAASRSPTRPERSPVKIRWAGWPATTPAPSPSRMPPGQSAARSSSAAWSDTMAILAEAPSPSRMPPGQSAARPSSAAWSDTMATPSRSPTRPAP